MSSQREMLLQIVQKAREDKNFFHQLVFNPDGALASLEGLDASTTTRVRAISPETFLVPALVSQIAPALNRCDPTCDESCGTTCGALSCDVTCGTENHSCARTCGASCGTTLEVGRL
jgi:hypothetical protein